jgi:hypothetical protein
MFSAGGSEKLTPFKLKVPIFDAQMGYWCKVLCSGSVLMQVQ